MAKASAILQVKWLAKIAEVLISAISAIVFLFFDFLDVVMCIFYRSADEFLEGKASSCYCTRISEEEENKKQKSCVDGDGAGAGEGEIDYPRENEYFSETLHGRRNFFRNAMRGFAGIALLWPRKWWAGDEKKLLVKNNNGNRWSDCGCEACTECVVANGSSSNPRRLHFVVKEPRRGSLGDNKKKEPQNIIFLHGFLSSSSFWTETVFPNLSETTEQNYRLFAVDLLGFGRSPKPRDCFYTLKDHVEAIENSLISTYQLNSFHIVAHSMGCVIALALAAKYSKTVKSVVLIAPPYFSSEGENASLTALEKLAARRIWPPLLFGSSFMSWYEHLGRFVCFIICRNHNTWESILKLVTWKRDLHFLVLDLTRHTHHSAWHTMHNVICGGAKLMDRYLEILRMDEVKMKVIQGSRDQVVPLECSSNMKLKVPNAEVNIIENADHNSVILGREKDFTRDLECVWKSVFCSN